MVKVAEDSPAAAGKNRTVTETDCPGSTLLKAPPPLTTEKGAERLPTVPCKTLATDVLAIVIVWSDGVPMATFPKSTDAGVMEILPNASGVTTLTGPAKLPEQEGMQSY